MRKYSAVTRNAVLPLASLLLCAWTAAGAECTSKSYKMTVPDRGTLLRLADGEHKLGSVATEHGTVEARVSVKEKVVSNTRYFIEGKPLEEVAESALPEGLRECLKKDAAAGAGLENWFATAGRFVGDWLIPPAYAAPARDRITDTTVIFELCFKGTNTHQVCTYKACTYYGMGGRSCVVLFVTGA